MAFDLNVFAQEFGIDPATLQAKPDAFAKWNGYLTEADGKYSAATKAQQEAQTTLDAVKAEQAAINDRIASFNLTENEVMRLKANYAALEAQAKALKAEGLNLTIPEPIATAAVDPAEKFRGEVKGSLSTMGQILKVTTKYQQVFGKPLPDDLDKLYDEAVANRMSVEAWAAKKYDWSAEEAKQSAARTAAREAEVGAAAVKKYQEEHPVVAGNPDQRQGGASLFPELGKRPAPKDAHANFGGTPAQRIVRSVKRSLEGLAAAS